MTELTPLAPPTGSNLTLDVRADGLTLEVPRQPIRKASKGLFAFGILWLGFCMLFTAVASLNPLFGIGETDIDWQDPMDLLMVAGFMAVFYAVGIGMLLAAVNAARRRVILDVVGDTLLVTRSNLFGTQQHERPAADISAIHRGPTNTEINNVPIEALQIESRNHKKLQLLSHLTNEEIDFVADILHRALPLDSSPPAADPE